MLIFMNFLQGVRKVSPEDDGNEETSPTIDEPASQGNQDETRGTVCTETVPQPSTARTRLFKSPLKNRKRVFRSNESSPQSIAVANEALSIMKDINERRQQKDEYSLFGDQIAVKIRKLPTEYAKNIVQHKINNILFDAAMGRFNHPAEAQSYRRSHTTPYYTPFNISPASPYSSVSPSFSPLPYESPLRYSYGTQSHPSTSPCSSFTTGDDDNTDGPTTAPFNTDGAINVPDNTDGGTNVPDNTDDRLHDLILSLQ